MDGLAFIAAAAPLDPALGFVVLSAFDTDENLRRAIPLQVCEFLAKPLPDRAGFEARLPAWVARTRERRRELALARHAGGIARDLQAAQLEREVELVAAESARDALLQTANLLTTLHAHFVAACTALAARARTDPGLAPLLRQLEVGRRTAEAAATVAGGFFDSAYASRDTSPALLDPGLAHAIGIASRMTQAEAANKSVDCAAPDARLPVRGLSGVDFLLLMVPVIAVALLRAGAHTTVGVRGEPLARLDAVRKDPRCRDFLWANRRSALGSHAAVAVFVTAAAPSFTRAEAEAWLAGADAALALATPRGLVAGLQKCHGLLGLSLAPHAERFRLVVALPV
jgi:antitoxin (DNA-binding transcriptional repressor) of toxin-antitoxin stability system